MQFFSPSHRFLLTSYLDCFYKQTHRVALWPLSMTLAEVRSCDTTPHLAVSLQLTGRAEFDPKMHYTNSCDLLNYVTTEAPETSAHFYG